MKLDRRECKDYYDNPAFDPWPKRNGRGRRHALESLPIRKKAGNKRESEQKPFPNVQPLSGVQRLKRRIAGEKPKGHKKQTERIKSQVPNLLAPREENLARKRGSANNYILYSPTG